jgi:hypothetical protein
MGVHGLILSQGPAPGNRQNAACIFTASSQNQGLGFLKGIP